MARREFRDSLDKLQENLLDSNIKDSRVNIEDAFSEIDDMMDTIESKVDDAISQLKDFDETDIKSVNFAIEQALVMLEELSLQVY